MTEPPHPELLADALRRLMKEQKLTLGRLSLSAGIQEGTLKTYLNTPGRVPGAHIIEALAAAFDVPEWTFYEYPIAVARRNAEAAPKPISDEPLPGPQGELGRQLEDEPPTPQDRLPDDFPEEGDSQRGTG